MFSFLKKSKITDIDANVLPLRKLDDLSDLVPAADVLNFFGKLTDAYRESQVTTRELAAIDAQKEILLTEIQNKYDLYHQVFERIFDERNAAITKSFEIIDRGLQSGDRELVGIGMQGLSKIVSTSPFANLEQLSHRLEGNKVIEI